MFWYNIMQYISIIQFVYMLDCTLYIGSIILWINCVGAECCWRLVQCSLPYWSD